MSDTEKNRENRLRRAARRKGFVLRKSRLKTRQDPRYGKYGLLEPNEGRWAPNPFKWTLDDVERYLRDYDS